MKCRKCELGLELVEFNKNFGEKTSVNIINMLCNLQPLWREENLRKSNKFKPVG